MGKYRWFHTTSIRTRLTLFLLVLVIIPMILGFIVYSRIATNIIKSQLIEREEALLYQSAQQIDRVIGLLNVSVNFLASSSLVQRADPWIFSDIEDSFLAIRELQQAMYLVSAGAFQYPLSVFIINDQSMISTVSNIPRTHKLFLQSMWYQQAKTNPRQLHWTIEQFRYVGEEGLVDVEFLTVARKTIIPRTDHEAPTIAISIDTEYIQRILDPRMHIVTSQELQQASSSNNEVLILEHVLENGWILQYAISQQEMLGQLKLVENWGVFLVLLIGLFVTFIIVFNVHASTKNLLLLKSRISEVKGGNFSVRMPSLPPDEVGLVANQFNEMLMQIQHLFGEIRRNTLLLEEARFAQLQAQIRPHFLLNSLNTINWAAHMSGAYNVSHITLALCGILEKTLYQHAPFVLLSDEIKTLTEYITIEELRTGDGWELSLIPPAFTIDPYVPVFLLQPLVENAIVHATDHTKSDILHITVEFSLQEDFLICRIEDDGKGFTHDPFDEVPTSPEKKERYGGIGLVNIHQRIEAYFGKEYGVSIQKRSPKGSIVTVTFPLLEEAP